MDYKTIFEAIETSLYENAGDPDALRNELDRFKYLEGRQVTDEEFYKITLVVVFAPGIKTATMNKFRPGVRKHFPDIETAASYTPQDIERITASGEVLGNIRKVRACVNNACAIKTIVAEYGSMQEYIDSFAPLDHMDSLITFRDDLIKQFDYFGPTNSFHLMTDLGLHVLKPDSVIMRIFKRLGLLYDESQRFRAVEIGQEFAAATDYPIRYIDIVFVTYGQVEGWEGYKGICVGKNPQCHLCAATEFCNYYKK